MSASLSNVSYTRTNGMRFDRDPILPRFHMREVQDQEASAREGRPIFRSEEMVQFLIPASPNQPVFRVNEEHRQRWPDQYKAFRSGHEMAASGTPLEQWPVLNRGQVLEMKALEIHTVEQCAQLSDVALQRLGKGGHTIRNLAKAYLDDAEAMKITTELTHQNERLLAMRADYERRIDELTMLVNRLSAQQIKDADAPHPIATYVPGEHDPMEAMKLEPTVKDAVSSSLDALQRRPGRPRKEVA